MDVSGSEKRNIDFMTPMTKNQARDHVERNRIELSNNVKEQIVQPLQEIDYYKFFEVKNSGQTKINNEIIRHLGLQILDEIKESAVTEERANYVNHLWKYMFSIPVIYSGQISENTSHSFTGRSSSTKSKKSKSASQSKGSSNKDTKMIKSLKYKLEPMSKDTINHEVLEMEKFLYQKMDEKGTLDIYYTLLKCFFNSFPDPSYIPFNSQQDRFARKVEELFIRPLLTFFEFIEDEPYHSENLRINLDHLLDTTGNHPIITDIGVYSEKSDDPLGLIEVKKPYIFEDFLTNERIISEPSLHEITTQTVMYMIASGNSFVCLTNLSGMSLYELMVDESDLSRLYDPDEHMLLMRHTRIKCYLTEGEYPDQTLANMLEARTAIALIIHKRLFDNKSKNLIRPQRMKELLEMIKEKDKEDTEHRINQSYQRDLRSMNPGNLEDIPEGDGETETDANLEFDDNNKTYKVLNNLKLSWTKLDVSDQWFTIMRSSGQGRHVNEMLKMEKSTFVKLFKPVNAEISLLSRCQGDHLVMNLYTESASVAYVYENISEVLNAYEVNDPYEFYEDIVLKEYFWREVEANMAIMKHNLKVEKINPANVINSPIMVKFGAIIDHKKSIYGNYIIFEALNDSEKLERNDLEQLSSQAKMSIKRELDKLHKFAKVSHSDISLRNLFLGNEEVPRFIL